MKIFAVILLSSAMTCYQNGKTLREEGKQVEAMQCFIEAAHSGTNNELLLGRVYSNMANMCRQANEHQRAFEVYALSAEHFAASGDTLAYAYALNNMAWEQAAMSHKDTAMTLIAKAVQTYPQEPLLEKVRESRAAACLFAKEYDSVLIHTTPPANDYLLTLRAQAFSYLQIDDSATYYARLLLPRTKNLFALDDLYYILTHNDSTADTEVLRALSSKRADVQKAIEARHGELTQAVQLLQQDLSKKEQAASWNTILLWAIGIVLLVWGAVVVHKQRKLHLEKSAYDTSRRNELAQNIQIVRNAENLRQELAWNEYAELCRRTDKLFQGLADSLLAQGLNEQDIRLCVLVLIGLSHKEIAEMLNCSPKSIGKLKDLTAHKLGVSGGQLQDKLEKTVIL